MEAQVFQNNTNTNITSSVEMFSGKLWVLYFGDLCLLWLSYKQLVAFLPVHMHLSAKKYYPPLIGVCVPFTPSTANQTTWFGGLVGNCGSHLATSTLHHNDDDGDGFIKKLKWCW